MNYFSTKIEGSESRFGTGDYRVVVLRSLQDMEAWSGPWRKLGEQSSSDFVYFQSYDWCRLWWQWQAKPRQAPAIHLLLQDDALEAVLPLMQVRSRLGAKVLRTLGEPHTQYTNLLTRGGPLPTAGSTALAGALAVSGADLLHVNYVPDHSPLRAVLGDNLLAPELGNVSLQYDLAVHGTSANYEKTADKKLRQLRRRAETYLSAHGPLNLQVLRPGQEGYAEAIRHCIAMKMVWIAETARNFDGLGQEGHAGFLASLPGDNQMEGGIVFVLRSGDTPIAYQMGFLQRGHYYLYNAGFDWAMRAWSPGLVLIDMTVRWLIDHGARTFDLMGNPSGYKERMANQQLELSGYMVPFTLKGAAYGRLWARMARPALRSIYHKTPVPLRRGINQLRRLSPI